jgi:putative transposase
MEVDTSLSGPRVVQILEKLKAERGLPEEIGVDQGPEFISRVLTKSAAINGVRLHYASPGDKNENAFIESYNGRLRDECLNMDWLPNLKDT